MPLQVKSYEEMVPLYNVARVAAKDAQTLVVTAFDANVSRNHNHNHNHPATHAAPPSCPRRLSHN